MACIAGNHKSKAGASSVTGDRMAEDQFQRPYRASEPPVRASGKNPGSDPLAELARLIGQTDPFGEYGRDSARRAHAPQPTERSDWSRDPAGTPYDPHSGADQHAPQRLDDQRSPRRLDDDEEYYSPRSAPPDQQYGRQPYVGTPSGADDLYQVDHEGRGYPSGQTDYQHDAFAHDPAQFPEEEYYEDEPSSRRRLGVVAIAGVCALAVIGTAGAYGYRALFGSSASTQPPPVIKADAGPSKIVPATTGKDTQSNKLITDRVNERGQSEKLVSREEQPVPNAAAIGTSQMASQSTLGSGVVGSEPKKVRTIAIHPDQPIVADATPSSPVSLAAPARSAAPAARTPLPSAPAMQPAPPSRVADNASADAEQDAASAPAARSAPPVRQAAPASGNSPLSLSPDAAPARAAARAPTSAASAPARTAAVASPAQMAPTPAPAASGNAGGPGSYVQVSSQRSEAEAQAAFRSLQAKYPDQLGGRQPMIYKVDLGSKGTYYRAMVGPFTNASEAGDLCSSLKAAGGQCLIQKN